MTEQPDSIKAPKPFRKGSLVRVNRKAYKDSLESMSSDEDSTSHVFHEALLYRYHQLISVLYDRLN